MPDLWPNFANMAPPRRMMEMLYDAAADISAKTDGKIDFYVDAIGVGAGGVIREARYNCYLRVSRAAYKHLLFRVTTPVASAFPATAETPEGEQYSNIPDEQGLVDVIGKIVKRDRTTEIVLFLLNLAPERIEHQRIRRWRGTRSNDASRCRNKGPLGV